MKCPFEHDEYGAQTASVLFMLGLVESTAGYRWYMDLDEDAVHLVLGAHSVSLFQPPFLATYSVAGLHNVYSLHTASSDSVHWDAWYLAPLP
jgi:hypothetical protein